MNIKRVLFACLFLAGVIAAPVQGQQPTPPQMITQATNPAESTFLDCGLPPTTSQFTTSRTFEMNADCIYGADSTGTLQAILYFSGGTHTVNGNGYSIIGPPHGYAIWVQGSSTNVTLNDIVIRETANRAIHVQNSATLIGNNIVFRDNTGYAALSSSVGSTITLTNVEFLNNRQTSFSANSGSAFYIVNRGSLTINNGIFRGNRNIGANTAVIVASTNAATVTLNGCITFSGNVRADGTAAERFINHNTGVVTDNSGGNRCPAASFSYWLALTPQKKSKKTATPWPSATARPLATTCIDLNQATGIAVSATYGLGSGIQCQRLGGGGIGFQALADSFIDAVDIWGYVNQGVEVCFPQAGELLFLDARMMPRTISPLASTVVNGMTCGAIDSPGSIVLMPHS